MPHLSDYVPPQDLEAEQCVLGSMLVTPACIDDVSVELHAGHFYSDANRRIFAALLAMHTAGKAIDPVLVGHQLESTGELQDVGGATYLLACLQAVPHAAHAHTRRFRAVRLDVAWAEPLRDLGTPLDPSLQERGVYFNLSVRTP